MKHLVTGACGFLGSHLVERLVAMGDEVIALDSLFTGRRENIAHVDPRRVEFVRHDVCAPFHAQVDRIWLAACPASPLHYARNPVHTIKTCVQGTINGLELAREVGARALLFSTSEVYGDAREHPQREEYWGNVNPVGVERSMYDEGKRCAEAIATSWSSQYGTSVMIARIFNVFGPRLASGDGRMIPNFITQALSGRPLTIYGDGRQTRSLCYVDDTIDGLLALMKAGETKLAKPLPVNIGNPVERSVGEIAQDVASACGVELRVEHKPLPGDDPRQRCPDIARARKLLGWSPKVDYEDGMARTVAWFRGRAEDAKQERHFEGLPAALAGAE